MIVVLAGVTCLIIGIVVGVFAGQVVDIKRRVK